MSENTDDTVDVAEDRGAEVADEPYFGFEVDARLGGAKVPLDPASVRLDEDTVGAIGTIAKGMGYSGGSLEDMCLTWLRPICDCGWGATARGVARAKKALALIGKVLDGENPSKAMNEVGLSRKEIAAFRMASPEFAKVYSAAIKSRRELIGDDVLDTAYELATVGDKVNVRDKFGNLVGVDVVKNERLIDRLLSLSGPEFQRGTTQAMLDVRGANGGGGPAVVMNFHFDRNGYPGDARPAGKGKEEVIDV